MPKLRLYLVSPRSIPRDDHWSSFQRHLTCALMSTLVVLYNHTTYTTPRKRRYGDASEDYLWEASSVPLVTRQAAIPIRNGYVYRQSILICISFPFLTLHLKKPSVNHIFQIQQLLACMWRQIPVSCLGAGTWHLDDWFRLLCHRRDVYLTRWVGVKWPDWVFICQVSKYVNLDHCCDHRWRSQFRRALYASLFC